MPDPQLIKPFFSYPEPYAWDEVFGFKAHYGNDYGTLSNDTHTGGDYSLVRLNTDGSTHSVGDIEGQYDLNAPIIAMGDAEVLHVLNDDKAGAVVVYRMTFDPPMQFTAPDGTVTEHDQIDVRIMHGAGDSIRVRPGDHIQQGDVLFNLGITPNSTAPHLHIDFCPVTPEGHSVVSLNPMHWPSDFGANAATILNMGYLDPEQIINAAPYSDRDVTSLTQDGRPVHPYTSSAARSNYHENTLEEALAANPELQAEIDAAQYAVQSLWRGYDQLDDIRDFQGGGRHTALNGEFQPLSEAFEAVLDGDNEDAIDGNTGFRDACQRVADALAELGLDVHNSNDMAMIAQIINTPGREISDYAIFRAVEATENVAAPATPATDDTPAISGQAR